MNTINDITAAEELVAERLARNWFLLAIRGMAAALFGLLAFVWPGLTVLTLIFLFGIYAVINGVLALAVAYNARKGDGRFGSLIIEGVLSILVGIIAFAMPGITALSLLVLIAVWAIVTGIFEIVAAVRLRKVVSHEWLLIIAGLASLAFGVMVTLMPGAGALALVWWIGAYALAFGVLLMMVAFRMRNWRGFEMDHMHPV